MDIAQLAQAVTAFLAPFLPYLVGKAGDALAEVTVEKSLEAAWERATILWGKLRPMVERKPAAQEAAEHVAQDSGDEDAQTALRLQVKKLLTEDTALAAEVARLWEEARRAGVTVIVSGERSFVARRDVRDSVITTGDRNVVGDGSSLRIVEAEYDAD